MTPPANNIIPQNCKMTDNTAVGVGVQNLGPRSPLLPRRMGSGRMIFKNRNS